MVYIRLGQMVASQDESIVRRAPDLLNSSHKSKGHAIPMRLGEQQNKAAGAMSLDKKSPMEAEMMKESENWMTVADRASVGPDSVVAVKAGDLDIALYNIEGQFYATSNVCTHAHALLSDGWLDGDVIECPLHGGRFEVKTGKGLGAPITCDLKTFPVRVEGNAIQVKLTD
jgi:naphthalene 1,2-dioxygenase system ferredoxin subunit